MSKILLVLKVSKKKYIDNTTGMLMTIQDSQYITIKNNVFFTGIKALVQINNSQYVKFQNNALIYVKKRVLSDGGIANWAVLGNFVYMDELVPTQMTRDIVDVSGNVGQGSQDTGFFVMASKCSDAYQSSFYNNHCSGSILACFGIRQDPEGRCTYISGLSAYHSGVGIMYAVTTQELHLENALAAENDVGIVLRGAPQSIQDNQIKFSNSFVSPFVRPECIVLLIKIWNQLFKFFDLIFMYYFNIGLKNVYFARYQKNIQRIALIFYKINIHIYNKNIIKFIIWQYQMLFIKIKPLLQLYIWSQDGYKRYFIVYYTLSSSAFPPITSKPSDNFDSICTIQRVDLRVYINNVEFNNFRLTHDTVDKCGKNAVFKTNHKAHDATGQHYLVNSPCTNCEFDSILYQMRDSDWTKLGWFGGCGSFECTGQKNVLIEDQTGHFFGQIGQAITNNTYFGPNVTHCVRKNTWNGYWCPERKITVLNFMSVAADFNKRLYSPIKLTDGLFFNEINSFFEWNWDGPEPLNLRESKFVALVSTNTIINMSNAGMNPTASEYWLSKRSEAGSPEDFVILKWKFSVPQIIQVL